MASPDPALITLVREVTRRHPQAHPHTIACLLMAEHRIEINGQRVKDLWARDAEARRCRAADVARVLEAMVLEPHRIILHQPWGSVVVCVEWRRCRVWIGAVDGQLVVKRAVLPGMEGPEEWALGCERDDWRLGPESVIVEPLALLPAESRDQVLSTLAAAEVMELEG